MELLVVVINSHLAILIRGVTRIDRVGGQDQ